MNYEQYLSLFNLIKFGIFFLFCFQIVFSFLIVVAVADLLKKDKEQSK